MPLVQTRGAASAQGFGEFAQAAVAVNYIEDVFSTYLYTGNGSTQTITNGIDLSTKGGLVWGKNRDGNWPHYLADTAQGTGKFLESNTTNATTGDATSLTAFNTTGFSIGNAGAFINNNSVNYVSWTFRKQPKMFDIQTWTGSGANRTIAHSLGSVPGSIIVKRTDTTAAWAVYHRSLANTEYLVLNTTAAAATGATRWNSTTATSAVFSLGTDATVNASGGTYIAYIFAHDAGGFGLAGTDNVISCGTCSSDGSGYIQPVSLGYEPQWVMLKRTNSTANWVMMDTMRGMANTAAAASPILLANTSDAEAATGVQVNPTATGFEDTLWGGWGASNTYIYIAIRRGPMKVPTLGTSVYNGITRNGTGAVAQVTGVGFTPDLVHSQERSGLGVGDNWADRLRGSTNNLTADTTAAEFNQPNMVSSLNMDGMSLGTDSSWAVNNSSGTYINHFLRRAPSFFDEVCYTGTGAATTQTHNLGVAPELAIVKDRNVGSLWYVQNAAMFAAYTGVSPGGYYCVLNTTAALIDGGGNYVYNPTASTISLDNGVNFNTRTYVAYLFATCAGVSKVFSYTGNGSSQTINCGFTGGARFVLIKRTDSTGDWYVWDSARGIVAGNDPHLSLNTTAAEVTTDDSVDTDSTGFIVNQVAATNVNVSSATYIGLAVA